MIICGTIGAFVFIKSFYSFSQMPYLYEISPDSSGYPIAGQGQAQARGVLADSGKQLLIIISITIIY